MHAHTYIHILHLNKSHSTHSVLQRTTMNTKDKTTFDQGAHIVVVVHISFHFNSPCCKNITDTFARNVFNLIKIKNSLHQTKSRLVSQ